MSLSTWGVVRRELVLSIGIQFERLNLDRVKQQGKCNDPNSHRVSSISTTNSETNGHNLPLNWTIPRLMALQNRRVRGKTQHINISNNLRSTRQNTQLNGSHTQSTPLSITKEYEKTIKNVNTLHI